MHVSLDCVVASQIALARAIHVSVYISHILLNVNYDFRVKAHWDVSHFHMEFVTACFCIRINGSAHTWIIPDYLSRPCLDVKGKLNFTPRGTLNWAPPYQTAPPFNALQTGSLFSSFRETSDMWRALAINKNVNIAFVVCVSTVLQWLA